MVYPIQMDMDATGRIYEPTRFAQTSRQFLQSPYVMVVCQHWADQLDTILGTGGDRLSALLFLAGKTGVTHELPYTIVTGLDRVGIVMVMISRDRPMQESSSNTRSFVPGDTRELDLNSELTAKQF